MKLRNILWEIGEGNSQPFKYKKTYNGVSMESYTIYGVTSNGRKNMVDLDISLKTIKRDSGEEYLPLLDKFPESEEVHAAYVSFYNKTSKVKSLIRKGEDIKTQFKPHYQNKDNTPTQMVNDKQYMYRLMATIKEILAIYVKEKDPEYIGYYPLSEYKKGKLTSQRDMLYSAFIRKVYPGATHIKIGIHHFYKIK